MVRLKSWQTFNQLESEQVNESHGVDKKWWQTSEEESSAFDKQYAFDIMNQKEILTLVDWHSRVSKKINIKFEIFFLKHNDESWSHWPEDEAGELHEKEIIALQFDDDNGSTGVASIWIYKHIDDYFDITLIEHADEHNENERITRFICDEFEAVMDCLEWIEKDRMY